jgi:hypothetical protein
VEHHRLVRPEHQAPRDHGDNGVPDLPCRVQSRLFDEAVFFRVPIQKCNSLLRLQIGTVV